MAKIAVVFHSGYGHTARIAEHVARGASAELITIDPQGDITPEQWAVLDQADAIVFGSPTYMGMVSWQFKKFADATSGRWMTGAWKDKLAAGFTCSASLSGDKLSTLQYMVTLAMQLGMVWVGQQEANEYKTTDGKNRMGSSIGVMAQAGPQDSADKIPQGDLDTAVAYGQRVASVAAVFKGRDIDGGTV
jgi:NAD(P)H dehydrogenase (quinone)